MGCLSICCFIYIIPWYDVRNDMFFPLRGVGNEWQAGLAAAELVEREKGCWRVIFSTAHLNPRGSGGFMQVHDSPVCDRSHWRWGTAEWVSSVNSISKMASAQYLESMHANKCMDAGSEQRGSFWLPDSRSRSWKGRQSSVFAWSWKLNRARISVNLPTCKVGCYSFIKGNLSDYFVL